MKKISYFLTAACAVWALTSCEQDKDPKYHAPTEGSFELYAPALQDMYIQLTAGNTLELITSGQPDYGYSAVANYGAYMALSEDTPDSLWVELTPIDNHQSKMSFKQEDVAIAVCEILGIEDEDQFNLEYPNGFSAMPIYFKAFCYLNGVEGSLVFSNTVTYNQVEPYFAVPVPGYIYLVGANGIWSVDDPNAATIYADWRLYEKDDQIGSGIYYGSFELNEGGQWIRFYKELGDWGKDGELPSIGANAVDGDNATVTFTDGVYTSAAIPGKGGWYIDWSGGTINMVVDLSTENKWTVTFSAGDVEIFVPQSIFLMGTIPGWESPYVGNADKYEDYKLFNSKDAESVFTGTFDYGAGDIYIRFFTELQGDTADDGWSNSTQFGAPQKSDGENDSYIVTLTGDSYSSSYGTDAYNWCFKDMAAGSVDITIDTEKATVDFIFTDK